MLGVYPPPNTNIKYYWKLKYASGSTSLPFASWTWRFNTSPQIWAVNIPELFPTVPISVPSSTVSPTATYTSSLKFAYFVFNPFACEITI